MYYICQLSSFNYIFIGLFEIICVLLKPGLKDRARPNEEQFWRDHTRVK